MCFDLIDPSAFEFMERSPIMDSSQFITELLLYSVPGDTFAYQGQSNSVFNSFYKVNASMEFHILMCYAMFVDWRSSTDDSK